MADCQEINRHGIGSRGPRSDKTKTPTFWPVKTINHLNAYKYTCISEYVCLSVIQPSSCILKIIWYVNLRKYCFLKTQWKVFGNIEACKFAPFLRRPTFGCFFRSSNQRCSIRKGVLKNSAKFTKTLLPEPLF